MWECYCFSSQASMMSTSLNTPFQGFWNSCENVPCTNSCMTFLSRPDWLYVLSSNICGKQINASGMYGREWTFRGKHCHRDTAALSVPTGPTYLCSSSVGFKWSWKRPHNSGTFFNEKWGGHHSDISQKSCFSFSLGFFCDYLCPAKHFLIASSSDLNDLTVITRANNAGTSHFSIFFPMKGDGKMDVSTRSSWGNGHRIVPLPFLLTEKDIQVAWVKVFHA